MKNTRYGEYGGVYLPEILMSPLFELDRAWENIKNDKSFHETLADILKNYAGRPTPLTKVSRFAKAIDGPHIYLKREDLLHTGAHKLNNALGQCLLAKKMGKKRIIAETGAGQHGVATATASAFLDLDCTIYMGEEDMQRQAPNVLRMQLLGAHVACVQSGSKTLKDAINEALRDWSHTFEESYYCLGSALGPHPYPEMVAHFQSVIGEECEKQFFQQHEKDPDMIIACVGGGSNAIGIFSPFLKKPEVRLIGVEAMGAARFNAKTKGVLHGCFTYVLQSEEGQIAKTHSISAGLDYPSVSPIHADLYDKKRVEYVTATDDESVSALRLLARTEGIIAALESAHALAYLIKVAPTLDKNFHVIVNLSGRGDKDLEHLL